MALQTIARLQRAFTGLTLFFGVVALVALGSQPGLRDFALIVALFFSAPLCLLIGSLLPSWRSRLVAATGLWCILWAVPILWQHPWTWRADTGGSANWWTDIVPDLAPFFLVPAGVLLVVAALQRLRSHYLV